MRTPLATITRLLVTPERNIGTTAGTIDVNISRTNLAGHSARMLHIATLNISGETIGRIVSNANSFLFAVVRDHC